MRCGLVRIHMVEPFELSKHLGGMAWQQDEKAHC